MLLSESKKILFFEKKKIIISLICLSFIIFGLRNIERIIEEHHIVKENNFPLFFSPQQNFEKFELKHNTISMSQRILVGVGPLKLPVYLMQMVLSLIKNGGI